MTSTRKQIQFSSIHNTLAMADNMKFLPSLPDESVDLVFTSPPYYNAKPEYSEYESYPEYLEVLGSVFSECHRVLSEGRFLAVNISPVLIPRSRRSDQSRRLGIPFDVHGILVKLGFDFMEDIVWIKPSGVGWSTGRNRKFKSHRTPLAYKPNVVTEYILVFRKHTDKLIDWNIRKHPDQKAVENSKVEDGYEETNVWEIAPARSKKHPAVFPLGLAERVIKYYSFQNDVVLDPYAGIGTTAQACVNLDRRYVMVEQKKEYFDVMVGELTSDGEDVMVFKVLQ